MRERCSGMLTADIGASTGQSMGKLHACMPLRWRRAPLPLLIGAVAALGKGRLLGDCR